jgi:murein DD-endopeptidase MepM/ murein hydrolase activator NlpD
MTASRPDRSRGQAPGRGRLRRLAVVLSALVAMVFSSDASAQIFRVVSDTGTNPPSYQVPNQPGSIAVPFSLSSPPPRPAVRSYEELLALWQEAGAAYGVPWQVLGAINKIESNFGQNMGPSSAGALGWMQFIPSSWARWGMDGDGDGLADPWNPEDAVYAAARYLAAAGAQEDIERAIFAYNHAQWYVDDVMELAALFGDGPLTTGSPGLVFQMADLKKQLADARRRIVRANRAVGRAKDVAARLAGRRLRAERHAGNPLLSDAEFRRSEETLTQIEAEEARMDARLERLRSELDEAIAALEALRNREASAGFAGALAGTAAEELNGYVFPVGGGPSVVSVAHTHHDYPAADIAAPEGSPLYALADSTVIETYPDGNGKCGTGLKLLTETGAVFVYCHLSYLEPDVVPGAALGAGVGVGLVGSTGNSTGPHLHLGFVPALSYPQEEPWFKAFAGRAFSWQDAPTPKVAGGSPHAGESAPRRVFRVIRPRTRVVGFTR